MNTDSENASYDNITANITSSPWSVGNNTSGFFTEKPVKDYAEYKYASLIRQYGSLLILVLGVLGNCFCMLVLFQKHNRKRSCYLYFGAIAIADNILLINAGVYQSMVDFSPEKINNVVCRLANGLWYGASFSSAYVLFFATVDR